jgi:streptogramin lyase
MVTGLAVVTLFCIPGIVLAQYDFYGNEIGVAGTPDPAPGDPCGTCPDPSPDIFGLTFKDGSLWALDYVSYTLYHLVSCTVVATVTLTVAYPAGIGYDTNRGLFIVTDPGLDLVHQVDVSGTIINTWPSPGPGPVGAAYDPMRDVYWISDWETDVIAAVDPNTGLAVITYSVSAGSRIAGTGYDEGQDVILYNGRNEARTYWMSAATGMLIANFPNPGGGGGGNGQGAAIAPNGHGWIAHFEQPTIYCIEGFPVPTENASWGRVKALYR